MCKNEMTRVKGHRCTREANNCGLAAPVAAYVRPCRTAARRTPAQLSSAQTRARDHHLLALALFSHRARKLWPVSSSAVNRRSSHVLGPGHYSTLINTEEVTGGRDSVGSGTPIVCARRVSQPFSQQNTGASGVSGTILSVHRAIF